MCVRGALVRAYAQVCVLNFEVKKYVGEGREGGGWWDRRFDSFLSDFFNSLPSDSKRAKSARFVVTAY